MKRGYTIFLWASFILASFFVNETVHAISAGCADLNGRSKNFGTIIPLPITVPMVFGKTFDLEKNEFVTVRVTATLPTNAKTYLDVRLQDAISAVKYIKITENVLTAPTDPEKQLVIQESYKVTENQTVKVYGDFSGNFGFSFAENMTVSVTCQNIDDVVSERGEVQQDILTNVAAAGQRQVTQMTNHRSQQRLQGSGGVPQSQSGLAFELNGQQGKSAGDLSVSSAVWGNMAVTHYADHHSATDYSGLHGVLMVGADHFVTDSLLIGGALNAETSYTELGRVNGDMVSTALGLTPYLAWQIDDVFSLSAQGNVSFIQSRMSDQILQFQPATVTNTSSVRWSLSVTGDGFWQWGNWGLLSGLNLSYGQLLTEATRDSQGNRVGSSLSQNGAASLMLQPSYYWQYTRHLAMEPYILAEYQYDFTMQKVSTQAGSARHPNDPDQLRLGLGLNIFGGAYYSGNVEATTVIGRQDYSETSLGATLRVNF